MLDTVKINHVQHISFTQSRLTDAVSVILSELLSYEHPSNWPGALFGWGGNYPSSPSFLMASSLILYLRILPATFMGKPSTKSM